MHLTWFGHASFRIVTQDGTVVYIDPYAGEDAWYDKPADVILVTHGHFDHIKDGLIERLAQDTTVFLSTSAVAKNHQECKPVWPDENHEARDIRIRVVHAYSLRQSSHPKGEGVGFVLQFDNTSLYVAGDTDFIPEMRKVLADVVLLPVGGTYTMGPRDAATVCLGMKPKHAVPCHWGGRIGTLDDAEMFKELVDRAGQTQVHILHANQTIEL